MYVFYKNGTVDYIEKEYDGTYTDSYNYEIDGNNIYIYDNHGLQSRIRFIKGAIYSESYEFSKQ